MWIPIRVNWTPDRQGSDWSRHLRASCCCVAPPPLFAPFFMLRRSFQVAARTARARGVLAPATCQRGSVRLFCLAGKEGNETEVLQSLSSTPVTHDFHIVDTTDRPTWPMFQMMDLYGAQIAEAPKIECEEEVAVKMYTTMARLKALDDVFYNAQRQGRISFYMQSSGEEGLVVGSAAGLKPQDIIFAQYRESGALLWRGFTVQQCADQCYSNEADMGKGRQMPIHYGSNKLNFQTVSSPLTTQLPQAAGAAYALKQNKDNDAIAMCYFGEGAASEGDFHAALNFAATMEVPIIYFCRNNGYAISTPTKDQYRGDGIISRAAGYGMYAIRVDGNDTFAVKKCVEEARRIALEESRPVFIEAMSYRRGHHSTSDDSTRYRSLSEINDWAALDPMKRFQKYMLSQGWWDEDRDRELLDAERMEVLKALEAAEKKKPPPVSELFTDVYDTPTEALRRQEKELKEIIAKYPEYYKSNGH